MFFGFVLNCAMVVHTFPMVLLLSLLIDGEQTFVAFLCTESFSRGMELTLSSECTHCTYATRQKYTSIIVLTCSYIYWLECFVVILPRGRRILRFESVLTVFHFSIISVMYICDV